MNFLLALSALLLSPAFAELSLEAQDECNQFCRNAIDDKEDFKPSCECIENEDGTFTFRHTEVCEACFSGFAAACFYRWQEETRSADLTLNSEKTCHDNGDNTLCQENAPRDTKLSMNGELCQARVQCGTDWFDTVYTYDCANVDPLATQVNLCEGKGFFGTFEAFQILFQDDDGFVDDDEISRGNCNGENSLKDGTSNPSEAPEVSIILSILFLAHAALV